MSAATAKDAITAAVLAELGGTPVARENYAFQKPTNAKWARLTFIPNLPSVLTLGQEGDDLGDGIVQVDFIYPAGIGDQQASADSERFRSAFKAGASFVSQADGQAISIRKCGRSVGRIEDNWFIVSVTIEWYSLIQRT